MSASMDFNKYIARLSPDADFFVIIEVNWGTNSWLFWVNLTKTGAKIAVLGSVAYPEFRLFNVAH